MTTRLEPGPDRRERRFMRPTIALAIPLALFAGCGEPPIDDPGALVVLAEDTPAWLPEPFLADRIGEVIDGIPGGEDEDAAFVYMLQHAAQLDAGSIVRVLEEGTTPAGTPFLRVAVERPIGTNKVAAGDVVAIQADRFEGVRAESP
jgi:hypothetical protein